MLRRSLITLACLGAAVLLASPIIADSERRKAPPTLSGDVTTGEDRAIHIAIERDSYDERTGFSQRLASRALRHLVSAVYLAAAIMAFWAPATAYRIIGRCIAFTMLTTLAYHTFEPDSLFDPRGGLLLGLATLVLLCSWALSLRPYRPDFAEQDQRARRRPPDDHG